MSAEQPGHRSDRASGRARPEQAALDRTDARRLMVLLSDYGIVGLVGAAAGRPRARVRLSRFWGDYIPIGVDVLRIFVAAGYLECARCRGDAHVYRLSEAGRAAVRDANPD